MRLIFILLTVVLMVIPSCRSQLSGSVIASHCYSDPTSYYIDDNFNVNTVTTTCNDYTFDPKKLHDILDYFVIEYSNEFNISEHDVWNLLSGLTIETSVLPREEKNVYSVDRELLKKTPVSGLALSKDWIWVELKTRFACHSSLIHELVHIIIWRTQKIHADPDHEGEEYSGWTRRHTIMIDKLNTRLCDLGL